MKMLKLVPRKPTRIPLEAEALTPDNVAGKTLAEVQGLPVYQGNAVHSLSDHFTVTGELAEQAVDQQVTIDGDASHVKYIGAGMTAGTVIVNGDAGMHTGAQMTGGSLTVHGDAHDWAGAEMKGGTLTIQGDAGNQLGAAYRGSSEGMTGGCILVKGSTGSETAGFMRRGMLIVVGGTGPFTGVHMNGGEIFIFGEAGSRLGAQARGNGGFIAALGGVAEMLPTYMYDTTYKPAMMRLYLREIADTHGVSEALNYLDKPMRRYRGDLAVGGNAEILVAGHE